MADARTEIVNELDSILRTSKRRDFLKLAAMGGMGAFFPAIIAGCNGDTTDPTAKAGFNFSSDRGALNLAYAYTQFMADFYARVQSNPYVGMTTTENGLFFNYPGGINYQLQAQRNTLQNLITSGRITDAVLFNFTSVDFSTRSVVMGFAQTFGDLGVAAINGSVSTVKNATNLTLLGKIVSALARQAAAIRDLNDQAAGSARTSFAATADAQGLDPATDPKSVITTLQPYFRTTLSTSGV